MAYIDQASPRDRAASVAGVIAVHAAVGYALVVGLQFTGIIEKRIPFVAEDYTEVVLPPPPPPDKPAVTPEPTTRPDVYTPPTVLTLPTDPPDVRTVIDLPPPTDFVIPKPSETIPPVIPGPAKRLFDPVAAKPTNTPGNWLSDTDYRTVWINREMEGIAGFRLTVGTNGRVESCTITQSTGHAALDEATCKLVSRRARFEAARDADGNKTMGSFSSKVRWRIPD